MEGLKKIDHERKKIYKAGKLHWVHWLVVVLSLILTVGAWQFSSDQIHEKIEAQFIRESDQVVEQILERMRKYEDGLWGGVAAIQAQGGNIAYKEWLAFANSLRLDVKYPGINGIGVIHFIESEKLGTYLEEQKKDRPTYSIHPAHNEDKYWPITYIEPVSVNAKAVGLDMAHEVNRRTAAEKARDTGLAQITGPITLVQDSAKTPGFLFYAPFYSGGLYDNMQERKSHITGLVYAPFVVNKLVDGTLDKEKRHVGISITDGDELVYDEHSETERDFDPNPLFKKRYQLDLYGRNWSIDVWSSKDFRASASTNQPLVILFSGIFIDTLLLILFVMLSRSNRRAIGFADRMTGELQLNAKKLKQSNKELEEFAYVASHDLKTPLRGIGDLAEYLKEDLEEYLSSAAANPDVSKNLGRLDQQVKRMNNLISGILAYSRVGREQVKAQRVDMDALVRQIGEDLNLSEAQLIISGRLPVLEADMILLDQILSNLIGNAAKYHHNLGTAEITVSSVPNGKVHKISVSDNGPGIAPQYHEKIFEAFQTLQPKDEIESTGIGLSVVKKAVESQGGTIIVSSIRGTGSTFTFTWPK